MSSRDSMRGGWGAPGMTLPRRGPALPARRFGKPAVRKHIQARQIITNNTLMGQPKATEAATQRRIVRKPENAPLTQKYDKQAIQTCNIAHSHAPEEGRETGAGAGSVDGSVRPALLAPEVGLATGDIVGWDAGAGAGAAERDGGGLTGGASDAADGFAAGLESTRFAAGTGSRTCERDCCTISCLEGAGAEVGTAAAD